MGHALQLEFPELTIEQTEAKQLTEALLLLLKSVKTSSAIPLVLKESFAKQASVLMWWLSNSDSASVQQLVECVGSTVIVARQIAEDAQTRGETSAAAGMGVYEKVIGVAKSITKYARLGSQGVQAVAELTHDVHSVAESVQQILPSS